MGIAKLRGVATLAACLLIASCIQPGAGPTSRPPSGPTITFRNQDRDRVQVYLVGEKQDWLIGRLESMETAHLPLPELGLAATTQPVALVVVPGWARNLRPRQDPHATVSINEISDNLPGEEWIFAAGQLQGPLRARAR